MFRPSAGVAGAATSSRAPVGRRNELESASWLPQTPPAVDDAEPMGRGEPRQHLPFPIAVALGLEEEQAYRPEQRLRERLQR